MTASPALLLADPEDRARDVELGEPGEISEDPEVFAGYPGQPEETAAVFLRWQVSLRR